MSNFRLYFPLLLILAMSIIATLSVAARSGSDGTQEARKFIEMHVAKLKPLEVEANRAWWDANTTGKDEDFKRKEEAQNRIDEVLANPELFKQLKAIKTMGIDDPVVAREIEILYLAFLEKQVDPALLKKMTALSNQVEKAFNAYRAKVDGKELTDSQVRDILKTSKDSNARKTAWEASKGVGAIVEKDLRSLVKLRNESATKLGFKNYHALQLYLNEQDGDDLIRLFDELDDLTREPFRQAKAEVDEKLAANCHVAVSELMPWHYHDPFFQEAPAVYSANLDAPYAKADLLELCRRFYASIGLPIDDVIGRSDLYEKKGKSPHAFCTDIDREGDVRVLANIVKNEYWMGTMLHELGHSVYSSKNMPRTMPYLLRREAHILTTEGVAMMFERLSKQLAWLQKMGVAVDNPQGFAAAARQIQRNQLLIFSRWCQVMLRFEKSMYENPDQDLSTLWWGLAEKYQMIKRPPRRNAPDYAAKIHIVTAPVYYHNYQLGQLFASQLHHAIAREIYHGADSATVVYVGNRGVGNFMTTRVFSPGRSLSWNQLTQFATGELLNAKAFAADFKGL